ncbi:hypothetical protein [Oscillatoria salina]|uniref:hypothetical protein n=1 Tax=Oscillatoria salina TaxID=331517 RepID=UPI0013B7BEEF|nr:hypothetical protein [Oscillatoria salina]MBZ8180435.1 hypothetical protein [Oscillatoria salina IIICB1]NET89471.1 hypothetical protein [Kamptonema sp. SIO1D9]
MSENKLGVCPVCGVKILRGDLVIFSYGAKGNRIKLWERVCQYATKPGCINPHPNSDNNS